MVAARIATLKHGGTGANQHKGADAQICASAINGHAAVSLEQAAKMMNVGRRSVQAARVVYAKGVIELQQAVEAGAVAVTTAESVARRPLHEQRAFVTRNANSGNRMQLPEGRRNRR
jgi:hypothetical protein